MVRNRINPDQNGILQQTGGKLGLGHYLSRHQLMPDEKGTLKTSTILFFWEATPPEVDGAYAIEKPE
jgi:hypothetical protein